METAETAAVLQSIRQPQPPQTHMHPGLSTLTPSPLPSPRPQRHPHNSSSNAQMSAASLGDDLHLLCPTEFIPLQSSDEHHARLIAARLIGERKSSDNSARGGDVGSNSALFALNSHFSSQQHKREQQQLQRELQLRRQMQQAASQSPMPLSHSLSQSRSNDDLQFTLAMHFRRDGDAHSRQHSRHSSLNSIGPVVQQQKEQSQMTHRSSPTPMVSEGDEAEAGAAQRDERKEPQPMDLVTAPSASSAWAEDAAPAAESSSASADEVSSASSSVVSDAPPHHLRAAWRVLCSHPELNRLARAHIDKLDEQMTAVSNALVERHNERMADSTQPLSEAARAAAAAQFNTALDHLGRSFCQAGERVVELCHQRALRAAAIAAKNDLLYDQASPETSSHGSSAASVDEPSHSNKRAKLISEGASPNSITQMNDDTDDDETPRRSKKRGGSNGKSRATKRKPRVKIEGEDASDAEEEEEPVTKSKSGVKRKQRTPTGETKGIFTEAAIAFLRKWLDEHLDDPYPDAEQKHAMGEQTGLTYGQVQHWFINARMRYWRPLIAARKAELEASMKRESLPSLSDLSSAATHAAPIATAANESKRQIKTGFKVEQPAAAAAAVSSSSLVPRSGRSYMLDPTRTLPSLADTAVAVSSGSGASPADLRAASVLSLSMASSYQTPHSYVDCHPLHPHRKYKSGGKNNRVAAWKSSAKSSGSKTMSRSAKKEIRVKQEPESVHDGPDEGGVDSAEVADEAA